MLLSQPAWHPWVSTCSINCSCSFLHSLGSSTLAAGLWHRHRKSFWLEEHTSRPYPGAYEHSSKGDLDAPSNWCLEFASEAIFKPIKGFSFSLNCSSWETEFIICYTSLIAEMHIKLGCLQHTPGDRFLIGKHAGFWFDTQAHGQKSSASGHRF